MSAPKILRFSHIDQWQEIGFFPKILLHKKGSILDTDLPKPVIIEDTNSGNQFHCELIEIIQFRDSIPTVLALLATKQEQMQLELELLEKHPENKISDFAFFFYRIHSKI